MPTARDKAAEAAEATEATPSTDGASALPSRGQSSSAGIPARGGSSGSYAKWAPVVQSLRDNLGEAWSYENVENVQTEAQGIRRSFGVRAVTRGFDKASKRGTLWLEYPSVLHDDGTRTENTAEVADTLAKYAK